MGWKREEAKGNHTLCPLKQKVKVLRRIEAGLVNSIKTCEDSVEESRLNTQVPNCVGKKYIIYSNIKLKQRLLFGN